MKHYLLLLPFLFILGCEKDVTNGSLPDVNKCRYGSLEDIVILNDPSLSSNGFVPMHFKNYWVYYSEYWDLNGNIQSTRTDSVYTTENMQLNGLVWWSMNLNLGFYWTSTGWTSQVGDTLFGLSCGGYSSCVDKYLLLSPIGVDTARKNYLISCDMGGTGIEYISDSTIATPAGNFTGLYVYAYDEFESHIEFLKPGVGTVKLIYFVFGRRREVTLIDYHLE